MVFCFLVVLYFQVVQQLRKGDEIEIYELDYSTNKALNDAAALKQPFIFRFSHIDGVLRKELQTERLATIYGGFETTLQESLPYESDHPISHDSLILTMPPPDTMPAKTAIRMLRTDKSARYFSDHNHEFVAETGLAKRFQEFDSLLRPPLCVRTSYDVWCGSAGAHTPLQYHMYERRFLYVTEGNITIKMTPWRSVKYMASYRDHAQFGFVSPLNVWAPQEEYLGGYEKMRFLEFSLEVGQMLYLPPFWHYSVRFRAPATTLVDGQCDSCVAVFDYCSPTNLLIQSPYWAHSLATNYQRNSQLAQKNAQDNHPIDNENQKVTNTNATTNTNTNTNTEKQQQQEQQEHKGDELQNKKCLLRVDNVIDMSLASHESGDPHLQP